MALTPRPPQPVGARQSPCGTPRAAWSRRAAWVLVTTLFTATVPARASDDHDRARAAVEAGRILPLEKILETVRRTHPGTVLDVELESHREGTTQTWIYEIKLLRPGGERAKLKVDASTGALLPHTPRKP